MSKPKKGNKKGKKGSGPVHGNSTRVSAPQRGQVTQGVQFTPQKKKGNTPARRGAHHPLMRHVCAITDPFCTAARGMKQYGGGTTKSLGWQLRQIQAVTTGSAGQATVVILANPYFGHTTTALTPSLSFTTPGQLKVADLSSFSDASALFPTPFGQARIVSFGVVFRVTASMSDASGYIIMNDVRALSQPTAGTAIMTLVTGSINGTTARTESNSSGKETSWISKESPPESQRYRTVQTTYYEDYGFNSLIIEVVGGPASKTIGTYEVYMNLEVVPQVENATVSRLATDAHPPMPVVTKAQQIVQKRVSGFIQGGVEAVENKVAAFATDALSEAASFLGEGAALMFGL